MSLRTKLASAKILTFTFYCQQHFQTHAVKIFLKHLWVGGGGGGERGVAALQKESFKSAWQVPSNSCELFYNPWRCFLRVHLHCWMDSPFFPFFSSPRESWKIKHSQVFLLHSLLCLERVASYKIMSRICVIPDLVPASLFFCKLCVFDKCTQVMEFSICLRRHISIPNFILGYLYGQWLNDSAFLRGGGDGLTDSLKDEINHLYEMHQSPF